MNLILLFAAAVLSSSEFMVDTRFEPSPAWDEQRQPAAAYGAGVFAAVWLDAREGPWVPYATRVSADGGILDSIGVRLPMPATYYYSPSSPDIAYGDSLFFVVHSVNSVIYAARVSLQGTIIGAPIALGGGIAPCVAFDGNAFCVTWSTDSSVVASRIAPSGDVLAGPLPISTDHAFLGFDIAFCEGCFLLVGQASGDVAGVLFQFAGQGVASQDLIVYSSPFDDRFPTVAAARGLFLVVFECDDYRAGGTRGVAISPKGVRVDDFELSMDYPRSGTGCCANTDYFFAFWARAPSLRAKKIDATTLLVDPTETVVGSCADNSRIGAVFGDTACLVVCDGGDSGSDIEGMRLSPRRGRMDAQPFTVSTAANCQDISDLVRGSSQYLLTWTDMSRDSTRVRATVAPGPDAPNTVLYSGSAAPALAAASHGSEFAAVLVDTGGTMVRVDGAGAVLTRTACPVGTRPVALVEGAGNYFLYETQADYSNWYGGGTWSASFSFWRIGFTGLPVGPREVLYKADYYGDASAYAAAALSAARLPASYALAYSLEAYPGGTQYRFERFDLSGRPLQSSPTALPFFADGLAFNNGTYLTVARPTYYDGDVRGARLSGAGVLLDTVPLELVPADVLFDVTPGQRGFLILSTQDSVLTGTGVDTSGWVFGTEAISDSKAPILGARACAGAADSMLVAWTQFIGPPYNSYRLLGRYYDRLGVAESSGGTPAVGLDIHPLGPSPSRGCVTVEFQIPTDGRILLAIYDVQGKLVRTLTSGVARRGTFRTVWDGRDGRGSPAPSGVYFCRLSAEARAAAGKVLLLR